MPEIESMARLRQRFGHKFAQPADIFRKIRRGDRVFIGTGCGEPQYLVQALLDFAEHNPSAIYDAEVMHIWSLGLAPYAQERFQRNFRLNSFFISRSTREAVNRGAADYTPVFLSRVPDLIRSGLVDIDVALIQTSLPDVHDTVSLGISVDIVQAAVETARVVVAQINPQMPRIYGDGYLPIADIDWLVVHDEPLLEFTVPVDHHVVDRIGQHVAQLVQDGDTIQVGYGAVPNAVLRHLRSKRHLGVHTELLGDGIVELMRAGVIDNSLKTRNRGKSVAAFCMGSRETYRYLDDNPMIEFRGMDYTNAPMASPSRIT
jgi:acyl-CoA hydrolase